MSDQILLWKTLCNLSTSLNLPLYHPCLSERGPDSCVPRWPRQSTKALSPFIMNICFYIPALHSRLEEPLYAACLYRYVCVYMCERVLTFCVEFKPKHSMLYVYFCLDMHVTYQCRSYTCLELSHIWNSYGRRGVVGPRLMKGVESSWHRSTIIRTCICHARLHCVTLRLTWIICPMNIIMSTYPPSLSDELNHLSA